MNFVWILFGYCSGDERRRGEMCRKGVGDEDEVGTWDEVRN